MWMGSMSLESSYAMNDDAICMCVYAGEPLKIATLEQLGALAIDEDIVRYVCKCTSLATKPSAPTHHPCAVLTGQD